MTTRVEVNFVKDLPVSLREAVLSVSLATFKGANYNLEWAAEGDWQITVWKDDIWVSVQQIFERSVYVDGQPVPVAGLGNLMTLPHWRNCGYGTQAFTTAIDFITHNLHCEYGMMFCAKKRIPLGGMPGWQIVRAPVTCWQSSGPCTLNDEFHTLVSCLGGQHWPCGQVELRSLPW